MTQMDQPTHVPPSGSPPKRPKGILKNPSSSNANQAPAAPASPSPTRPSNPRELSEREVVLANTLHNAGQRRSTSRGTASSRRQSGVSRGGSSEAGDGDRSPRLQWDEANLYLAEQEREAMGERMRIDEPKTPFAKQYDPTGDEAEVGIDPDNLMVDEVDKKLMMEKDKDVPDLDIGGPEMEMQGDAQTPEAEKRVMVEEGLGGDTGDKPHGVRHGEQEGYISEEEREKHRKFEEMRKKHYEMRSVKNLLGHPEAIGDVYDDDDVDENMENPPLAPVPKPADAVNGQ